MHERQRFLNNHTQQAGAVVYWISRDLRAEDHWGLLLAQQEALLRQEPLYAVFCLQSQYLGALPRAFSFLLTGLNESAAALTDLQIPLMILEGEPHEVLPAFCSRVSAGVLYCDFSPLRLPRIWRRDLAQVLTIPLVEVDAHNIIPCWLVSDHQEYGAYTIRPKFRRQLADWLVDIPVLQRHPFPAGDRFLESTGLTASSLTRQWQHLSARFPSCKELPPAGSIAGRQQLQSFLADGLLRFDQRNDPNAEASSRLSPWLHFGQLAPQRVALAVRDWMGEDHFSDRALTAVRQAEFLEELVVRRELADNYCFYNLNYDRFAGFPEWARKTLRQHQADPRPAIYSLHALESAETSDPLWNAAQTELVETGWMPGYLRMYWAKKILEWTPDPETAQSFAITLNDRYLLDGRDPNGYTGIAWSIGGVHDRAWGERPVYGKIRTMTLAGCRRKFDVDRYIETLQAKKRKEHSERAERKSHG